MFDYSQESAIRVAEIKKQLEVKTTYFISFLQIIDINSYVITTQTMIFCHLIERNIITMS